MNDALLFVYFVVRTTVVFLTILEFSITLPHTWNQTSEDGEVRQTCPFSCSHSPSLLTALATREGDFRGHHMDYVQSSHPICWCRKNALTGLAAVNEIACATRPKSTSLSLLVLLSSSFARHLRHWIAGCCSDIDDGDSRHSRYHSW